MQTPASQKKPPFLLSAQRHFADVAWQASCCKCSKCSEIISVLQILFFLITPSKISTFQGCHAPSYVLSVYLGFTHETLGPADFDQAFPFSFSPCNKNRSMRDSAVCTHSTESIRERALGGQTKGTVPLGLAVQCPGGGLA